MSQRFCLRWNNHQSNMLSVFDQLLHDESFVDVTLAVDGQLLKAHKMVLSACSPLFQALFIGHPDKHPIVILKDVPYADMRCLLDFMYRGEVSVDQDRLTAFLKVAESLRIKGLTEVNEEKCDIPSITNNLLSSLPNAQTPPPPPPPPPHLHRLPHSNAQTNQKKSLPPLVASNPLLGSALTAPKRKRGRPRKLSGSSNGDPSHTRDNSPHDDVLDMDFEGRLGHGSSGESLHSSPPPPDLMEMHMDYGQQPVKLSRSSGNRGDNMRVHDSASPSLKDTKLPQSRKKPKEEHEPTPGTSQDSQYRLSGGSNSLSNSLSSQSGNGGLHNSSGSIGGGLINDSYSSVSGVPLLIPKLEALSRGSVDHSMSPPVNNNNNDLNKDKDNGTRTPTTNSSDPADLSSGNSGTPNTPSSGRQPTKRARRRRATSTSQDPAEQLTEMSVRGLNLFRYASVAEGVYKCMECAKVDVNKTFKNKYSFQRHAFLYHEGHQRKVFPCPVCAKEFSRPDKMKNHMKTVHDCFMPKDCVFPVGFYMPP